MLKVLFVSYICIGDNDATGQTLSNMFKNMEDISILQLCLNPVHGGGGEYPMLNCLPRESITNYFISSYHTNKASTEIKTDIELSSSIKSICIDKVKQTLIKAQDLCGIRLSKKTIEEIKSFKPDLIYTLGGSAWVCEVCCSISKKLNVPVVMHSMDDHIHSRYRSNSIADRILRKRFYAATKEIYKSAKVGIAIGPKMAEEYEKEFGIRFYWAMNSIEAVHYHPPVYSQQIRLIFSGGVHGGRDITLAKLIDYINTYNQSKGGEGKKVILEIYTNPRGVAQLRKFNSENIIINQYVPREKIFENLSRATMLLHVESFDKTYQEYFRLSMSTKIPEYLSVGRPILFLGPAGMGTGDYLEENSVAFCVVSAQQCGDVFDRLNQAQIDDMCQRALALVEANHRIDKTQRNIMDAFKCALGIS